MSHEHLIHRLSIDIHGLKTNQEYQKLANRISAIVRSSFNSRLDRLLNELDVQDYHIILDYIEVDLGLINVNNLENNIISKLEKQLNKVIPAIKGQILYKIKNDDFDLFSIGEHSQARIKRLIEENLKSFPGPIKADIDINISASNKGFGTKVLPKNAKFLDAVIHYLEHGYFSRKLYVSDEVFAEVFTSTVLTYQKEIAEYFKGKSEQKQNTALERFQKQLSSSAIMKSGSSQIKKKTEKLFDTLYHDKIQALVKSIQSLPDVSPTYEIDRKEIVAYLDELYSTKKSLPDIIEFFKDSEKEVSKTVKKKSIDTLLPGDLALLNFKEKLKILLDERDRSSFDKFLEDPFVLSLNKSYVSTIDSMEIISQAFLQLIAYPELREEILTGLPAFIESEADIITQIYKKSPSVLRTLLQQSTTRNLSQTKTRLFLNKLPKKHLNLVMRSMVSYYSKLAPVLNYVNEVHREYQLPSLGNNFEDSRETHISQVSLLHKLLDSPTKASKVIEEFIAKAFIEIQTLLKRQPKKKSAFSLEVTSAKFEKFTKDKQFIKTRIYRDYEKVLQLSVRNVTVESSKYSTDPEALSKYQLSTLLTQFYIPFTVENDKIIPANVDTLIKNLKKQRKNKAKAPITQLFKSKAILKNSILRHLSYSNFRDLLSIALPTDSARKFIRFFEKYSFIWQNTIEQADAQLIFLSLIDNHRKINEATIFKHYFDKLKQFKAWNSDVQRKRIVDNYELNREKLKEEVRMVIIQYIDDIPTLESLAFKESRKKLAEGVPVKNAGLVLLWPFLKTLFNFCDYLTKEGDFKDSIARERAVLLLQYMAVKSSSIEEPYLALNKIMTGFPLDQSIATEIILSDKEKDIADALLINVIRQWPSFQNSSPDNLRGSFLIRDGILYFRGGQWVLQVENKSYDLLLAKLPWGFSLIRLSWLPYMVKVEWN